MIFNYKHASNLVNTWRQEFMRTAPGPRRSPQAPGLPWLGWALSPPPFLALPPCRMRRASMWLLVSDRWPRAPRPAPPYVGLQSARSPFSISPTTSYNRAGKRGRSLSTNSVWLFALRVPRLHSLPPPALRAVPRRPWDGNSVLPFASHANTRARTHARARTHTHTRTLGSESATSDVWEHADYCNHESQNRGLSPCPDLEVMR